MKSLRNLTHLITNVIFLFSFIHSEINTRWPFPRKSHFDAFQCNDVTYVFSESWTVVCKCPPDPIEYYIDVLQWRHNESDCGSNHRRHECLLNRLYMWRSKKTSKLHVNGLWEGNSLVTGQFPAQSASNAENISIWWRHHDHIRPWAWQTVYSSLTWTKSYSLCMAIYSI